ncbi:MAG: hypothetical protein KC912_09780 [Proteobacteria bacterium]|nr:hypothetical protein [Pseudomonadota bacterium]
MTRIYRGHDPVGPFLVRDWLKRNGIRAELRGTQLIGLGGGIPVPKSFPTIWVPEAQRTEAERLLSLFNGPSLVHPEWVCRKCGENNAPTFGSCWSCQAEP